MYESPQALDDLPPDVLASLVADFLPDPKDVAVLRSMSKTMCTSVDATGRNPKYERDLEILRAWRESCPELRDLWKEDNPVHWGVDATNAHGSTPLHLCARYGHLERARVLIDKQADLDARDEDGFSPLDLAMRSVIDDETLYEMIKLLVVNGADPNGVEDEYSRTFYPDAALPVLADKIVRENRDALLSEGKVKLIRLLLATGAKHVDYFDPNILEVVMKKRSADITLLEDILILGRTGVREPLELAVNEGHVGAVYYLLGMSTEVNGVFKKGVFPDIDALIDKALKDKDVKKKLIKTVLYGSASDVKVAIEEGANVNIGVRSSWEKTGSCCETFINVDEYNAHGLYPHYESRFADHDTFHCTTTLLHIALLRLRYFHDFPRDTLEHFGMTIALEKNCKMIVQLLVQAGADVNAKDIGENVGDTPFHLAVLFEEVDLINMMLDHGADVDVDLRPVWVSRLDQSIDLTKIPKSNLWGLDRSEKMSRVINAQLEARRSRLGRNVRQCVDGGKRLE